MPCHFHAPQCMKMKQRDNRIFALRLEKLHGKRFFEVPLIPTEGSREIPFYRFNWSKIVAKLKVIS